MSAVCGGACGPHRVTSVQRGCLGTPGAQLHHSSWSPGRAASSQASATWMAWAPGLLSTASVTPAHRLITRCTLPSTAPRPRPNQWTRWRQRCGPTPGKQATLPASGKAPWEAMTLAACEATLRGGSTPIPPGLHRFRLRRPGQILHRETVLEQVPLGNARVHTGLLEHDFTQPRAVEVRRQGRSRAWLSYHVRDRRHAPRRSAPIFFRNFLYSCRFQRYGYFRTPENQGQPEVRLMNSTSPDP